MDIFNLIKTYWIFLLLITVSLLRVIPPEWAGFWKYNNNKQADGVAPKITILRLICHNLVDGIVGGVLISFLALFNFKQLVTLLIFLGVGFDLFLNHQISPTAVTLIAIGVIVLYLDKLIETGKHIEFLKGFFIWDKDDQKKETS